jgi:hypothetical protein
MRTIDGKKCRVCGKVKPWAQYGTYKGQPNMYPYCRKCNYAYVAQSLKRRRNLDAIPKALKHDLKSMMSMQLERLMRDLTKATDSSLARLVCVPIEAQESPTNEIIELWRILSGPEGVAPSELLLLSFRGKLEPIHWDCRTIAARIIELGYKIPTRPSASFHPLPMPRGHTWASLGIVAYQTYKTWAVFKGPRTPIEG